VREDKAISSLDALNDLSRNMPALNIDLDRYAIDFQLVYDGRNIENSK
jgi:hypothetical protein